MNIDNLLFDARNIITVLSFLSFLGIVWWAYSGRRGAEFESAANLPFVDEMNEKDAQAAEKQNG